MKSFCHLSAFFLIFLLSACGGSPEALHRKGVQALNDGANAKAARLLEKAAEKTEGEAAAERWALAGLAAAREGRGGDAEAFMKQALELDPAHPEANYNLGDLLIQQNRLEEAAGFLEKAVLAGQPEALEALAGIALREGDLDGAYALLQQARELGENARVLTTLAVAGKSRLNVEESRSLLQRAVTLDPNYAPAQLNLASLLDQHRLDPAQAMSHYEAFLRIMPEDDKVPLVRQRLQIMAQRQEDGDFSRPDPVRREVEELLDQAAAAAENGETVAALQQCLRANAVATRAQRPDLRERALRAAATLAPDSARAQFGLGQFLQIQGRGTEAMIALEKARTLAPGWQMTLRPTVELAVDLGRTTAATTMLQNASQAAAADPDFLLEVGDLYAEALNSPADAKRIYQDILNRFPDYPQRSAVQERLNR